MKALQTRLDLILERIESPKFLKNDGLGNEIGFWVFDYPAKYELLVREHLKHVDEKLNKRGYRFVHLNIFEVLIDILEFVLLSGLGSAWPLVRGHELLSALQDVMGSTPLVLFYPGEYSGRDLHPFGMIESKNYYRAFKLVPEDGKKN